MPESTDHRAEAEAWLRSAAAGETQRESIEFALIGIGHALLAGLPHTIKINGPAFPRADLIEMMLGPKAAADWVYEQSPTAEETA